MLVGCNRVLLWEQTGAGAHVPMKKCCVPFTSLSSQLASQRCDKMLQSQHEGKWCLQPKTMFMCHVRHHRVTKVLTVPSKNKVSENMLYMCFLMDWALDTTENGITHFLKMLLFFLSSWSTLRCCFYEEMLYMKQGIIRRIRFLLQYVVIMEH